MVEQHEKTLVPQIRFAGFTDPWEQRKLGELASKRIEKNSNGIKETFTNSAEHGVVSQLDYFDHDITNDANIGNYSVVYPDDFVYNPRISTIAPCGPINRNKLGRNGVMSPLYTVFSVDDMISKLYLEHYFKTNRWHQFMFLEGNSGARSDRFSISDSIFFEMPIQCPVLEEQELIASFFDRLDSLITLHQRKYDKLCVLKKSMLDKMFPKGGSLYPEIRFSGFTDPWEQRKLGEFGSVAMCKRIYKEQTSEQGDVPFFKIGTFGANPDAFISNELFEDFKCIYPYPTPGTLLISAAGSIGRVVEYQGEKAYFQDSNIVWLEHDHRLNDAFLKPLYSRIEWGLEGSTIKRLYNKDLLSAEVTVPGGREQKEIGQFFAKLDNLITLHQRKLELLRNIKKSMLDKMFV